MYTKRPGLLIVLLAVLLCGNSMSQTTDSKKLFDQGVIYYQNQLYKDAFKSFESVLSLTGPNPYETGAYLMLGKTSRRLGDPMRAASYLDYLNSAFPTSQYRSFANYVQGQIALEENNIHDAFYYFAQAREFSTTNRIELLAASACDTLLTMGINHKDLLNIYHSYPWQKNKLAFQFWVAESYLRKGDKESADRILDSILAKEQQDTRVVQMVNDLRNKQFKQVLKIGIVVPVTGYFSQEAKELVRGMAFALHEHPDAAEHIDLRIADSKGSQVGTVLTTLAMDDNEFNLLIGELEDNNSISLAGYASQKELPLIIPVATSNGLASIGDYIFQSNNDLAIRGKALADYAVHTLGMKTFATLAPSDEYGHTLTDAFTNRVDQLGATIIAQKWYYPGTTDMKRQFDAIREAGLRHGFRDTLAIAGLEVTQARIDSIYHVMDELALEESDEEKGLLESTDIEVRSIDGFFFPIYTEELSIIAPQMALSNIVTTPLGGGFWHDPVLLRRQRNYLDGSIFVTGSYISETNVEYKKFVNDYRQFTTSSPQKLSIYGYNIMNMIIKGIARGNTSKESIVDFIQNSGPFDVIGGQISFQNSERVNNSVNILQYKDGNLSKIN